jgi:hypothetical protein
MKIVSFILISLLFVSCLQNQQKEKAKTNSQPDSLTIETVEINDSTHCDNYRVEIDTAWLYARPDSNAISGAFLTKNQMILICHKKDGFGYAVQLIDSYLEVRGWLELKYLQQMIFTPPKIMKE